MAYDLRKNRLEMFGIFRNAEEYDNMPSTSRKSVHQQKSKRESTDEKRMSIRDYERKLVIERGGKLSDEDDDDEGYKRFHNGGESNVQLEWRLKQE